MKAQDLRIGNYVKAPLGEIMRIDQIGHLVFPDYIHARNETEFGQNGFEGIELTPEILEKCGFDMHARSVSFADSGFGPKYFYYILDGVDEFSQRIYRHGFILGNFKDGYYYQANQRRRKGVKIEYLHQLQNLYFSLTGQELEVKL